VIPRDQEDLVRAAVSAGVRDPRVLQALREVARAQFVPADLIARAYIDVPIAIPHGQVTTQPSLVARMIEGLELTGSERVLEIGTGYGFQTALLAHLARFVWSIERWPDIADEARANLIQFGVANQEVIVGDGTQGLPQHAPYDAILVSAAFPQVPPPLVEQLASNGRLVQPIGLGGQEEVVLFKKGPHGLLRLRTLIMAHFVKLYGAHGFPGD
jgi:protein-L-isoaspartate(D-aspartate) O-methyltransferase